MADKSPAFQFYPKDFLTDERVVLMSNTEVGIYVRLLCFCWLEGTLPLETVSLAHMARMPLKQFTRLWENSIVKTCFKLSDEDGRLHHKRLDEEREKQASAPADCGKNSTRRGMPSIGNGARLRLIANSLEYQDAESLVRTWPDERLEKLAKIVLTTDDPFIAGTDRSFKIFALKASWADDRLRQWEKEHGVAV
jgi:uncharacterized protein YdaU (DUF1376 family)